MNADSVAGRRPQWTMYALGGGLGHLTRAMSLARYAARNGIVVRIVSNSPFLPGLYHEGTIRLIEPESAIELVSLSSHITRDELVATTLARLEECQPADVLVVDCFPRGLGGEIEGLLPNVRSLKVFVHRDMKPDSIRQSGLRECLAQYDLVIAAGEDGPLRHFAHERTEPWLICDCGELPNQGVARAILGVDSISTDPVMMVVGSGTRDEALDAAELARRLSVTLKNQMIVRFSSLDPEARTASGDIGCALWPLLFLHEGIDVVVGAGGYHTVHEARATGKPLLAVPQRRLYDRQFHRLRTIERMESYDNIVTRSLEIARQFTPKAHSTPVRFVNGAATAFEVIRNKWQTHLERYQRQCGVPRL